MPVTNEPRHDKTNTRTVRPSKNQISLGIRPVWSESSLSTWRNFGCLAAHWAPIEDRYVFAGRILSLLLLSWGGSCFTVLFSHPSSCFWITGVQELFPNFSTLWCHIRPSCYFLSHIINCTKGSYLPLDCTFCDTACTTVLSYTPKTLALYLSIMNEINGQITKKPILFYFCLYNI